MCTVGVEEVERIYEEDGFLKGTVGIDCTGPEKLDLPVPASVCLCLWHRKAIASDLTEEQGSQEGSLRTQ